jgi:hypothetical protein
LKTIAILWGDEYDIFGLEFIEPCPLVPNPIPKIFAAFGRSSTSLWKVLNTQTLYLGLHLVMPTPQSLPQTRHKVTWSCCQQQDAFVLTKQPSTMVTMRAKASEPQKDVIYTIE